MHAMQHQARVAATGIVTEASKADWRLSELSPPSLLLHGLPDRNISTALGTIIGIQARLLSAAVSNGEIDPLWVCRVLQALGDEFAVKYSPLVLKMAEITGADLPAEPQRLHSGLGLREFIHPGEWRLPPPYKVTGKGA
ncbi:hypothetical protein [Rhodanobacter sp. L36]|uniref:hypothetical protein n=1 Tax=Rhodanobacter sp. L36 TaxID=1747221 RepID=UPI00131E3987|nr:hypothetical protein [Rhodanobacter sp. L36]